MTKRILAMSGFGIGIGLVICSGPQMVAAQQRTPAQQPRTPAAQQRTPAPQQQTPAAQRTANTARWTPPKTAWGEPDLRGMWPLNHLINTPFQRPERFGDRKLMSDEEFAAAQKSAETRNTRFESGAIPQADS